MQNALFTYRRKVKINNEDVFNDNYINPLNVLSFYWQINEDGQKQLSVFLANNYTVTFMEGVGTKFVNHMEDFLRLMLGSAATPYISNKPAENTDRPKHSRRAVEAIVEDEVQDSSAAASEWAAN